jgi:membrane protein DedA with SNARE-associated domain
MDFFDQLLDFLKTYGTPVVLLWSLVETDLVFLVVGALASSGAISPLLGFLAAILGALTHDSFVFWLAKNRANWVRSRKTYQMFSASVEKLANKTGPWQLTLCRPLYGTRYPAVIYWGLRDLSYSRFVVYTLAGLLPWTLMLAAIGYHLSGHIDQFDDWLGEAKNFIFGGVLTVCSVLYLRYRLTRKRPPAVEASFPGNLLPEAELDPSQATAPQANVGSAAPPEAVHPTGRSS